MAEQKKTSEHEKSGGQMTVEEAGHKGGQKVKELVEKGEEKEAEQKGEKK